MSDTVYRRLSLYFSYDRRSLSSAPNFKHSFEEMFSFYEEHDFIAKLKRGDIWKITGGEPMLRQKPLLNFVENFKSFL